MGNGEKLAAWIASVIGGMVIVALVLLVLGIDPGDVPPILFILLWLGGSRIIIEIWFQARKH